MSTKSLLPSFCLFFTLMPAGLSAVAAQEQPPAQKQQEKALSGRELLAGCEQGAAPGAPNQYCMRYVFGLVQTVVMVQQMDSSKAPLFCIDPKLVSLQEVTTKVTDWLKTSRDRLDEDAYVLVSEALHQHYPCSRG
jgi:hypothetical protein